MSNLLAQISSTQFSNFTENLSIERIKTELSTFGTKFSNLRPPQEFFDVRRFSKPANFSEIQQRVSYNLSYYQSNYIGIVGLLSIYALITNALLMFVLFISIGGVYGISRLNGQDLTIGTFGSISTSQLYTTLLIVCVPLGFLASPISTMMWLIGASSVSVLSHASFMEKPIETVFEEQV